MKSRICVLGFGAALALSTGLALAQLDGLPATSGIATPVGPAGGDLTGTFPNPTLNSASLFDDDFELKDDGDATRILKFDAALVPTGTTLTFKVPSASGTLARLEDIPNSETSSGNYILPGGGCGVAWNGDLDYTIAACTYVIQGVQYTSPQTDITLDAADPTLDRFDAFIVDTSSVASDLTGTPAANPEAPDIDSATQLQISLALVTAGSTSASGTVVDMYREHVGGEWAYNDNTANLDPDSVAQPHSGTKAIEATTLTNGNFFGLVAGGSFDPQAFNAVVMWLRPKAAWPSTRSMRCWFQTSTVAQVGSQVTINNGAFGLDTSNLTYQALVISTTLFNTGGALVDRYRCATFGSGATIGAYFDDIYLQAGVVPPPPANPKMLYRGDYSASVAYQAQDVVRSGGRLYVATASNVGSAPVAADTNPSWKFIGLINASASVTSAMLRDSTALSVIGRAANSTGVPADVSATAASDAVLRESGGALGFGAVATAGLANNAVTDGKLRDSAGFSVIGKATTGTGDPADITAADATVLGRTGGGNVAFGQVQTDQVAADAITYGKLQNTSVGSILLGRGDSGAGDPQEITVGANLTVTGTTLAAGGGATATQVDEYLSTGANVWTKPAGAKLVRVYALGAGGGGASGNTVGGTQTSAGGSGGGGGALVIRDFDPATLGATETCTVGTGGTGGTAVTGGGNPCGNSGTGGGNTTFGTLLTAFGGGGGGGGTTGNSAGGGGGGVFSAGGTVTSCGVAGAGGNGGGQAGSGSSTRAFNGLMFGGAGGGTCFTTAGQQGLQAVMGGPGGGSGGAHVTPSTQHPGGDGATIQPGQATPAAGTSANGWNGANGAAGTLMFMPGSSGAGGAGRTATGPAGNGGNGGRGAGGGGGGGMAGSALSGAGGNGGNGACWVVTYFHHYDPDLVVCANDDVFEMPAAVGF